MSTQMFAPGSVMDMLNEIEESMRVSTPKALAEGELYGIVVYGCQSCESAYVKTIRDTGIPLFRDRREAQNFVDTMLLVASCPDGKGKVVETFIT